MQRVYLVQLILAKELLDLNTEHLTFQKEKVI
jgi:hypothetical protein